MSDQIADDVQPDPGQGDGGGDAPYAEYLNRIPEEYRGEVEPVFKDWDAGVTKRFQDAAEYRKQWEPYENLGVHQMAPERMQWALQFLDAHDNNPDAVVDWAREYAQANGLTLEQAVQQEQQAEFDQYGLDPQVLDQRLEPLMQRLEAFEQRFAMQEQQARLQEMSSLIDGAMKAVPEDVNPDIFDTFLGKYANDEFLNRFGQNKAEAAKQAVQSALSDYRKAQATFEKSTLSPKLGVPPGAEAGGVANAVPEEFKTLKEANAEAMERLRQRV